MKSGKERFGLAIILAILVLVGTLVIQTATVKAQPKEIKIGAIIPLTGPAAKTGEQIKWALEFASDEVNRTGGIKSMGGAKIKFILADHTGKAEVAVSETERLITMEKVHMLAGCYYSGITLATTEVAERYKIPWVVIIAAVDEITGRGLKYTFRCTDRTSMKNKTHIESIIDIGKKTGYPLKTAGFIYEHTDWGQSVVRGIKKMLQDLGVKVVLEESYPSGTPDFTPIVLKAKAANPDVILPVMYFQDAVLITKTFAQMKWYPKGIVTAGGGFIEPGYAAQLGKNEGKYITSITMFHTDVVETRPWAKKLNETFKAKYGANFMETSALSYSTAYFMVDALERAGTTDSQKLRDALASADITKGPAMLLPVERIKIGPDGQNPYSSSVAAQIQEDGKDHVVWPERLSQPGLKWIWPDPRWKP